MELFHFRAGIPIALPLMGPEAPGTVLDALFRIAEIAAAAIPQGIQGAVAENAAKGLGICTLVTGEVFTFPMLKKIIICHRNPPVAVL